MIYNMTKQPWQPKFQPGAQVWQAGEIGGSRAVETVKDIRLAVEDGIAVERFTTVESAAWRRTGGWSLVSAGTYAYDWRD